MSIGGCFTGRHLGSLENIIKYTKDEIIERYSCNKCNDEG